jgi:GxxExxY protein
MDEKDRVDGITRRIIGAAIEVHRRLGPGLLESAYEVCLAFELRERAEGGAAKASSRRVSGCET